MLRIGLTQRSISSTAPGMSAGSAARRSRWSGWASSWAMPPEMTWRVVSSPPIRISSDSMYQLGVVEAVAVHLGVDQDAHQVVGARDSPAARR